MPSTAGSSVTGSRSVAYTHMLRRTTCSAYKRRDDVRLLQPHTQTNKDSASGVGLTARKIATGGVGSAVTLLTYIWEATGSNHLSGSPAIPMSFPSFNDLPHLNTLRTGLLNCLNARSRGLTFRHRASCI